MTFIIYFHIADSSDTNCNLFIKLIDDLATLPFGT